MILLIEIPLSKGPFLLSDPKSCNSIPFQNLPDLLTAWLCVRSMPGVWERTQHQHQPRSNWQHETAILRELGTSVDLRLLDLIYQAKKRHGRP